MADHNERFSAGPWSVRGRTRIHGPFDRVKLHQLVRTGQVTPRHQISADGSTWRAAADLHWLWNGGASTGEGPDWGQDLIVRVARGRLSFERDGIDDVLFVAPQGLCFAQKRRNTPLPVLDGIDLSSLRCDDRRFAKTARRIPWAEVESATASWPCEVGAEGRATRRVGRDLYIAVRSGPPIRMFIPYDGATRVIEALRVRLRDRFVEDTEPFDDPAPQAQVRVLDVAVAIMCGILQLPILFIGIGLIVMWVAGYFHVAQCETGRRARSRLRRCIALPTALWLCGQICAVGLAVTQHPLLVIAALCLAWISSVLSLAVFAVKVRSAWLALPRRRLDKIPERCVPVPWFLRLCARWPRRWARRSVGLPLKILSVVTLCVTLAMLVDERMIPGVSDVVAGCGSALAVGLAYIGYRCSLGSALQLQRADMRPPIIFLRSFREDGRGSFTVDDWRATLLGLRGLKGSLASLGPIADASPIRIFRMLLGRGGDTAEEQLAGYMKRYGPFVAIGRPSEGLPTPGAARDYVDDSVWREKVAAWLHQARLVIIQPGVTEGVRWETERALEALPRGRVIFSLVSFDGIPEAYESFALGLRRAFGIDCPLYRGQAAFLSLEGNRAVLEPLCTRRPLLWPVLGCSADFDAMLSHRIADSAGVERPRPWNSRGALASIRVVAAASVWFVATVVVVAAIGGLCNIVLGASLGLRPAAPTCFGVNTRMLSHSGCMWYGSDRFRSSATPGFAFEVPGVLLVGGTLNVADPNRPAEAQLPETVIAAAELLGWRGRETAASDVTTPNGIRWRQQLYQLESPDDAPVEAMIRTAATKHGIAVHWAAYEPQCPCSDSDRLMRILDGVSVVGPPVPDVHYTMAAGPRWREAPPPEGVTRVFVGDDGARMVLVIGPYIGASDEATMDAIADEVITASARQFGEGVRAREVQSHEYMTRTGVGIQWVVTSNCVLATYPPIRLGVRLIVTEGWLYESIVVLPEAAGDDAVRESLDSLNVR